MQHAEKSTNVLGKMDSELRKLKEKEIQGAKENNSKVRFQQTRCKKRRIRIRTCKKAQQITATFDENIESEKEKRDEYQSELDKMLDGTLNDTAKGLSNFSDGLKELTGFDLMDTFDSVVSKINGVGLLFGNQDLFGDVVGGIQNLASGLKIIQTVSAGIMSGLKATGTYFSGLGETFKEGGLSSN